jgi:hypothetical protein
LIIGAMKAGTTTLYRDLMTHPGVYFPQDKEPDHLISPAVLEPSGREAYAALFSGAGRDQLCGEASTSSTKLPTYPGVAERAVRLLGDRLRVIYLMREPIARTISQHRHELTTGELTEQDLAEAVDRHPRLVDYSRYAMQLESWIALLGPDRVLALEMEAYTADRAGVVSRVQSFLGLQPRPELIHADRVYNQSSGKPIVKGVWRTVQQSRVYLNVVRPLLGVTLRERLRNSLLPKSEAESIPVDPSVIALLNDRLRGDLERLHQLLGAAAPSWAKH